MGPTTRVVALTSALVFVALLGVVSATYTTAKAFESTVNVGLLGWGLNDQCQLGNGRRLAAERYSLAKMLNQELFWSPSSSSSSSSPPTSSTSSSTISNGLTSGLKLARDPASIIFQDVQCSTHVCIALSSDNQAFVWGRNAVSPLANQARYVTLVAENVASITLNQYTFYILRTDGTLYANNYDTTDGWIHVSPSETFAKIECAFYSNCVLQYASNFSVLATNVPSAASPAFSAPLDTISATLDTIILQERGNTSGYWWLGSNYVGGYRNTDITRAIMGASSWTFATVDSGPVGKVMACGSNTFRLANGIIWSIGPLSVSFGSDGSRWYDMTRGSISDISEMTCAGGSALFRRSSEPKEVYWVGGEQRASLATTTLSVWANYTKLDTLADSLKGWAVSRFMSPCSASSVVFLLLTPDSFSDGSIPQDSTHGRFFGLGVNSGGQLFNGRMSSGAAPGRGSFSPVPLSSSPPRILASSTWGGYSIRQSDGYSRLFALGMLRTNFDLGFMEQTSATPQEILLSNVLQWDALYYHFAALTTANGPTQTCFIGSISATFNCVNTTDATQLVCSASYCIVDNSTALIVLDPLQTVSTAVYAGTRPVLISIGTSFCAFTMASGELLTYTIVGADVRGTGCGAQSCTWSSFPSISKLSSGDVHTLFLQAGLAYAFGSNADGQLGRSATTSNPALVEGLTGVITDVAATYSASFALTSTGDLFGWGSVGPFAIADTMDTLVVAVPTFISSNIQQGSLCQGCRQYSFIAVATPSWTDPSPAPTSATLPSRVSWGPNNVGQLGTGNIEAVAFPNAIRIDADRMPSLPFSTTSLPAMAYSSSRGLFLASNPDGSMRASGYNLGQDPGSTPSYDFYAPTIAEFFSAEGFNGMSVIKPSSKAALSSEHLQTVYGDSSSMWLLTNSSAGGEYQNGWAGDTRGNLTQYSYIAGSGSTYIIYNQAGAFVAAPTVPTSSVALPATIAGFTFESATALSSIIELRAPSATPTFVYVGSNQTLANACPEKSGVFGVVTNPASTRFVLHTGLAAYACGTDNQWGELGYTGSPTDDWHQVFTGVVKQVAALPNTNFLLASTPYPGSVYVWGYNGPETFFGFQTVPFLLSSAELLLVPWTNSIQTSPGAVFGFPSAAVVQALITTSASTSGTGFSSVHCLVDVAAPLGCTTPQPGPTFECIGTAWVSNGNVTISGSGTQIIISGTTIINGNLEVGYGAGLTITFGANLQVSGCLVLDGSVTITLTEEDLKQLEKASGKSRTVNLISAHCGSGNGLINVAIYAPSNGCKKLVVQRTDDPAEQSRQYNAIFKIDSSRCNRWWIILVSVLGGIIVLVVIVALIATLTPLKHVVRPYLKRNEQKLP